MTRFYLNPRDLEKWMHQNDAVYTGDFCEGVLLDSFVVSAKNGDAAIYEHYVNSNCSDYYVEFERRKKNDACQNVWNNWYAFEDKYHEMWGDEDDEN